MTDLPVPSWEGVHESRWARLRRIDVKLVLAVLIGLISVTGAVMTWRAAQLNGKASGNDRQAIAETVLQEQNAADVETRLRDEQQAFELYKEDLTNAQLLEDEADHLAAAGSTADAGRLRDQAGVQREVANNLALLTFSTQYVQVDPNTNLPTNFLIEQRRAALQKDNPGTPLNPDKTAALAVDQRRRSQRLEGWTIPLVLAVALLTFATMTRRVSLRPWVASVAVVIAVVAASIGLLGG